MGIARRASIRSDPAREREWRDDADDDDDDECARERGRARRRRQGESIRGARDDQVDGRGRVERARGGEWRACEDGGAIVRVRGDQGVEIGGFRHWETVGEGKVWVGVLGAGEEEQVYRRAEGAA